MTDKASSSQKAADDAKMETFQSILKSLNIPDPSAGDNAQITPEMMQRLSERIMGLLGDNVPTADASSGVTEDGLPVVEINEPEDVVEEELPPVNARGEIIQDDIIRHDLLSPQEKARRLAAVARFMDELEAEETEGLERERAEARIWAEGKKRESAARAANGLAAPKAPRPPSDPNAASTSKPAPTAPMPVKKKSVRFKSEDSASDEDQGSGDLVFARLQKPSVATAAVPSGSGSGLRADLARMAASQPMKLDVVERAPGKPKAATSPPSEASPFHRDRSEPDSDDETPPQTPTQRSPVEASGRLDQEALQEIREDYERRRAQVTIDPAEIDLSLAGRGGIGSGGWDEENVPLEATLASKPKPSVSRFKAERMKEGGSVSIPEIIPAGSSGATFSNAIRLGRLQGEQLVATAESDSDEDFERKHAATLEALKNYGNLAAQPSSSTSTSTSTSTFARVQERAPPLGHAQSASRVPPTSPPHAPSVAPVLPTARAAIGGVRERAPPRAGAVRLPAPPPAESASAQDAQAKPKKVSRFKAEKAGS